MPQTGNVDGPSLLFPHIFHKIFMESSVATPKEDRSWKNHYSVALPSCLLLSSLELEKPNLVIITSLSLGLTSTAKPSSAPL